MSTQATIEPPAPAPIRSRDGLGELRQHAPAIFWYAVGVWELFETLDETQCKESADACSRALLSDAGLAVDNETVDIPHFGASNAHKCTAILCCYIVSRSAVSGAESPFIKAALDARHFQNCAHAGGL